MILKALLLATLAVAASIPWYVLLFATWLGTACWATLADLLRG